MKYKCSVCGYVYDESVEDVPFGDLAEDWTCPECGASKDAFEEMKEEENLDESFEENEGKIDEEELF